MGIQMKSKALHPSVPARGGVIRRVLLAAVLVLIGAAALPASAEDFSWNDAATAITLADGAIQITGSGATAADDVVTIASAGTYVLGGTLTNGQIRVAAGKNDTVRLVLAGVHIANETSAAIYASQSGGLVVILAEGTQNTLTDGEAYAYAADEDEPDAALFSKDDLTIGGSGSLAVTGRFNNGIGTKDSLVIAGGTLAIAAVNDGLRGRDAVTLAGGDIHITAGNDGIKANNTDADKGWIEIDGGSIHIESAADGIQAESNLTIAGGEITIVSGGGAAEAVMKSGTSGGWGRGQAAAVQTVDDAPSSKGLKAGVDLTIRSGDIRVDSADDSVHANGNVTISGGNLSLATGDDGVHADGDLLTTGGSITVTGSYEGLEGATVTIAGGQIDLTASDDGINAGGGSDGESAGMFGGDAFRGGNGAHFVAISGGGIVVRAEGDGIDSNGSLTFSGGVTVVHGPQTAGNGSLDADGGITVTGGTVLCGGASSMPGLPGSGSSQPSVALYYAQPKAAGTTVSLEDTGGAILAEYTAEKTVEMVILSAEGLREGGTYTIRTNGADPVTVTVSSGGTTGISDTGTAVSGFGGMGGRQPGGRH